MVRRPVDTAILRVCESHFDGLTRVCVLERIHSAKYFALEAGDNVMILLEGWL